MSVTKQLVLAGVLLLGLGAAGLWYYQATTSTSAEAAIGGAPRATTVNLVTAERGVARERIEAVGTTLAHQAVDIVSLASGRVGEIAFRPGERVEAGAVLVRLDDAAERAAVAEAQAAMREVKLALERAIKLRATVAQATIDELEASLEGAQARVDRAQNTLDERTIRAPFAGVTGMRRVDVGARVDDDTVLTTLDDLSSVELEFSVPENFFGQVRPGQPVTATSTAFPGREFIGRIATIDTRIGEVSRAFRVRASLPNDDQALPAGMFMHIEVVLEERPAVLIPEEAVLAEGTGTFVFTVRDGVAERRPVRLGQRRAGKVEVLDGVAPGEAVVQRGLQRLRDGAAVRVEGADSAGRAGQGGAGA